MIRLRFVTGSSIVSGLIRLQAGVSMPFTPSHVEALSQDGTRYIGAHIEDGIKARPLDYDAVDLITLPDGSKSERLVSLPCSSEQEAAFYAFVTSRIDTPYDWKSIIGFAMPDVHLHDFGHSICSAFISAALRTKGCEYFPWPMTKPFHHISPDLLFAILSTRVEIPH